MNYAEVSLLFDNAPAIRLLRRREHAPIIVAFLFSAFKGAHAGGPRPLQAVTDECEAYLAALAAEGVELSSVKTANIWLRELASDPVGILRIWHDENTREPMVELTADAERVLTWLEGFRQKAHVGVESKIREIWRDIETIVGMATENPDSRLLQIDRQIDELNEQKRAILEAGKFQRAGERAINEAYVLLASKVRQLPGDFREVEDRLRRIAREIASRALSDDSNRGDLLGYALDAHRDLAQSPQGQSVDGFLDFLRPPHLQDEFIDLVDLVYDIRELASENRADASLRNVFGLMAREARRVQHSRRRLVSALRHVLQTSQREENKAVSEALRECLHLIHANAEELQSARFELPVPDTVAINPLMSRSLWFESRSANLGGIPLDGAVSDPDALRAFLEAKDVDLGTLAENIRQTLQKHPYATLADVVREHPPELGIVEILGYILIALTNSGIGAVVDEVRTEIVTIAVDGVERSLRCPAILFAA